MEMYLQKSNTQKNLNKIYVLKITDAKQIRIRICIHWSEV
jgi:hypothetical protein